LGRSILTSGFVGVGRERRPRGRKRVGIMADAVKRAGGTLSPFDQSKLHGVGGGECYGLSLAWLGHQRRGASGYFTEIHKEQGELRKRVQDYMKLQRSKDPQRYKDNGLARSEGKKTERGFDVDSEGLGALCEWLCATSLTQRYFLISSSQHTMACVAGGISEKRFFDPNAGVGRFSSGEKLTSFVTDFFGTLWNTPAAKKSYWGEQGRKIDVVKLKST
jgi:hypothetical protein